MERNQPIQLFDHTIKPGETRLIELPVSKMIGNSQVSMPLTVIHGRYKGPRLLITAAIHGDELNGVEIIRRLINRPWIKKLKGTLIAIPVVNVLGVIHRSRYLPDRRDLNRSFPGSENGSLAARLAYLLSSELLPQVDCAIDLHTGAIHRSNLPQLRVHLENQQAADMAHAFGVPVIVNAEIRDGSMRGAGDDIGVAIITYEAGEALRFDETAITPGVRGIRNVMMFLDMLPKLKRKYPTITAAVAKSSYWVRASNDGFFRPLVGLGARVCKGELLGYISGPLDSTGDEIVVPHDGIVIGRNNLPLVLEGEALMHIARFEKVNEAEKVMDSFHSQLEEFIADNDSAIADE